MSAAARASVVIFGTARRVHRPRPFHARHLVRRCFERVHEVEEGVRRMNMRVVEHFVCQQISRIEPFLIEAVEADAPARARQIAQRAAVSDERFHVDHRVDAVAASAPREGERVARE